jgi:hypothetical protein
MASSIDDLFKALTEEEVLDTFLSILETAKLPARSWRKGGAYRTILRAVARTYSSFTDVIALFIRSGFLETAEGIWLTMLARYVYDVERPEATFATGDMLLDNSEGGGEFDFGPDEVRFINSTTKKTYTNIEAFTLTAGEVKTIPIRATEVGAASSAAPGAIDDLETTMLGVVVSNPEAVAGNDELGDPELRQLCKDKLSTLSGKGPRGAYRYASLTALRLDGTPVNINRVAVVPDPNTGIVTTYCAAPSGTPVTIDVDAAAANIEKLARPDTVKAVTVGATGVALTNEITVWAIRQDGLSAVDLAALVNDKLIAAVKTYPIGGIKKPPSIQGYLYGDFVAGVAKSAHEAIFDVDGADTDLEIDDGEVATLATTVTVRFVEAA